GLGEAAKRNVGTGANQIPDMSSFISSSGESGYQRLPGGKLIVWGRATVSLSSNTVTLNASFNNTDYRVAVVDTGMGCVPYGASPLSGSTFNLHRAGRAYDSSGTLQTITGASALTYIAIGN
ncbi:phage tail protein, partial [Citrobacter sp. CK203]|nr:phage tail protein [Citrobacter sp. CK203]MDM3031980.1 phage tail protein [Citrobacter sp. CK186]